MGNTGATALEFLEDARPFPGENRFIVGTFERGVTVYRQQMRALNLVYSLVEAKDASGQPKIPPGSRIAIIGGGAFGITAAAAAAYAKFRVALLERQQVLLPLQRGCETRWIHPRFYDWPDPATETRSARLPLMNWPAATAAQVATELERQFRRLLEEKREHLKCYLEVANDKISRQPDNSYEIQFRCGAEQQIIPSHVIIYAVGVGTETAENEPYWRNDKLGQVELRFAGGERVKYVVSGTGDGGLIDVFRLTVRDFRHDQIFPEMFGSVDQPLLRALDRLRTEPRDDNGWLFDQFAELESGTHRFAVAAAMNLLKSRRRSDTQVTLNGREESLRLALTLKKVSLSNALLAYCLFRTGAFTYEPGNLDPQSRRLTNAPENSGPPKWLEEANHIIVRHGTDREKVLRDMDFSQAQIDFVKQQKNSGDRIFPVGWWGQFTAPEDSANTEGRPPAKVEFVPPALMSHATTFVSTLGNVLEFLLDNKFRDRGGERNFRLALHRLVRFDGDEVYQQITPYAGRIDSKAGLGRYFKVSSGIVGLACRSGSLVIARKTNEEDFNRMWELTQLERGGAKPIKQYVDSLLACPFFAPPTGDGHQYVSLSLFVDSAEASFFDDKETLGAISSACRGFVQLLEDLHRREALRQVPTFYPGVRVDDGPELKSLIANLKVLGVEFRDTSDPDWKTGLTFKNLSSLDLEVGPLMRIGP